jgi:ABC-type Fe3+/spermidine/putrescine transport system ATPase subunit
MDEALGSNRKGKWKGRQLNGLESNSRSRVILAIGNLSKSFNKQQAVRDVTLEIRQGEFFSIVGPSGCGKTTLLRLIAGFEQPSAGQISFDGRDITNLPSQSRGIGMVFQNYALFPHMTVRENISFGLETKKLPPAEIRREVDLVVGAVHLEQRIDAPVPELSGGEQQRVAVARAIVVRPRMILFDEPLSNLDVALRVRTREEIKGLQKTLGITAVYVTHDQSEALALSDRVAVMNQGVIEQVGTPQEVYDQPATPFVAEFLGSANLLHGSFDGSTGEFRMGELILKPPRGIFSQTSGDFIIAIKPEHITPDGPGATDGYASQVESAEYQGFTTRLHLSLRGVKMHAACLTALFERFPDPGSTISVHFDWNRCSVFKENQRSHESV